MPKKSILKPIQNFKAFFTSHLGFQKPFLSAI
jgi:hypothetical protein